MEMLKSMIVTCIILFLFYVISSFLVLVVASENNMRLNQNINTSVRIMLE